MENDFCRYSIRRFLSFIKYIESVFFSLESHCLHISDRLNSLNKRVFCSQINSINLDCRKEFKIIENTSIRDFMLLDDATFLKNSYFSTLKDCEKILVLIKENFPKFFNYSSTLLDKSRVYSERAVDVNMEGSQSISYEHLFKCQKKDAIKIKSKKAIDSKSKKITTFKSSLEKILRLKSRSEKSLKHEDLRQGMIPQTRYLSPQPTLSREVLDIRKDLRVYAPNQSVRHSCSDFVCRRSSTFCVVDSNLPRNQDRPVSPPDNIFCPVKEEEYRAEKCVLPHFRTVYHSESIPSHLYNSHQNISKCNQTDLDNSRPAKRTARKKGIFNCSLFRKRSHSHSKSAEKVSDIKSQKSRDDSKSLNRSELNISSSISERCLTLPNLKSSEVDLTRNIRRHQILSIDLIKDYIDRSNNSLPSSAARNSVTMVNTSQPCAASMHGSPHSPTNCKCDTAICNTLKPQRPCCDSMISDNASLNQPYYLHQSASMDHSHSRSQRAISPLTINSSAFDNTSIRYSNVTPTSTENQKAPCARQISAPISYQASQMSNEHLPSPATNSAFEFWTRPYHEKMKASRRRLLDDKVGSKEAMLRSLSPHNLKINDVYDNRYHLHIIPEPSTNTDHDNTYQPSSQSPISHSKSFYSAVQYRLPSNDSSSIYRDYRPHSSASPVIENRLRESPISTLKQQGPGNEYLIYSQASDQRESSKGPISIADASRKPQKESKGSGSGKIYPLQRKDFNGSFAEIKDNKSINSSTELALTRTPTPPHSFAASSVSSIYPAPTEFISDQNKPAPAAQLQDNCHKMCGTVNLLYTSDNSDDGNDEFDKIDLEPIPPVPPPRTDSVIRSLQAQQNADTDKSEQEYDISDEFPPVFSGANIDRCDIEQYHKWLEKLPYKISEFPNVIQCRKSILTTANKVFPLTENVDSVSKKLDLLALKQLKLSRKSIKSWTTSESSKPSDSVSIESQENSSIDSHSMKKSFSYDQCLNNSEIETITENAPTPIPGTPFPGIDTTLLKQYSHLYSLKPSSSQTSKVTELESSVLKFNRSKSIDLRNFVNNISGSRLSEKCLENYSQKRKSVPNTKFAATTIDISGKSNLNTVVGDGSEYKVYPML